MSAASTVDLPEPLRLLAPDGTLAEGHVPALEGDALLDAWRAMLRSRVCDERCFSLQRQGRLGTFSPVNGEEAAVVGSAWALEPGRDWIVPQYRELPAMLRFGYRLTQAMQYYTGKPAGSRMDADANVLPFQISLAAQLPHAVGLAWGLRIQGLDAVVGTYFGDGASSEGDAHEALNLAGVRRAPVVFVLKNNGWAISTPVRKQTAAASFAARAAGYGIAGELVDGNDLFAMHDACSRAVGAGARGGGADAHRGPDLPHGPAQHLRRSDALRRSRRARGAARLRSDRARAPLPDGRGARRRGLRAGARARSCAPRSTPPSPRPRRARRPAPRALFDHVYARPPQRLERQRAGGPLMAEMTMIEAIRSTLGAALEADERVIVLGQDVGVNGGVFRATEGLQERFGEDRVVDMPLAEAVIVGSAVGLACSGMIPIPELQFLGFGSQAFHQIEGQVARYAFRSQGSYPMPMVIRAPFGGNVRTPELHSDSHEAKYVNAAGAEGRHARDRARRQGHAGRGDPRPRPGALLRAAARLPADQGRGPRGGLHRPAGQGADGARGLRPRDRRLQRRGRRRRAGRRARGARRATRSACSTCAAWCRSTSTRCARRSPRAGARSSCTRAR